MSIQKKTTDKQSREFWEFTRNVSQEVGTWPLWKRQTLLIEREAPTGRFISATGHDTTSEKEQRMAKRSGRRTVKIGRDATTGRFIPVKEAERRQKTAVVETIKKKSP
jgi:hypothetical protein